MLRVRMELVGKWWPFFSNDNFYKKSVVTKQYYNPGADLAISGGDIA